MSFSQEGFDVRDRGRNGWSLGCLCNHGFVGFVLGSEGFLVGGRFGISAGDRAIRRGASGAIITMLATWVMITVRSGPSTRTIVALGTEIPSVVVEFASFFEVGWASVLPVRLGKSGVVSCRKFAMLFLARVLRDTIVDMGEIASHVSDEGSLVLISLCKESQHLVGIVFGEYLA